jgi:hypothetical protein
VGAAKAVLLALGVLIPLLGALVHIIADRPLALELSLLQKVLSAAVFAGLPAAIVFAGIGARLASRPSSLSLRHAMRIGATKGALAGLGLGLLVAIPTGALAHSVAGWIPLLLATGLAASMIGTLAAYWIRRATKERLEDKGASDAA